MAAEESKSVRNGIIATVIGGLILAALAKLWPPFKGFLWRGWEQVTWLSSFFTDSYSVKGWVFFSLALLAFPTIIRFLKGLRKNESPPFTQYIEDLLYGAKWQWSWTANEISNLWCLCPQCHSELVYNDSSCNPFSREPHKTDFICEHCGVTVASIPGGNKNYALSAVQREIRRRIRTKDYLISQEKQS